MSPIQSPLAQYVGLDGKPLDAGYVYIGEAGQNPETNPITVYWDEAGTQPALQPLRTLNGYIARNGTPTDVYADSDYSTTVRDSHNRLIITKSQFGELANASQIGYGGVSIASLLLSKIGHVVSSIEGLRDIDHTKYTNACVTGYYAAGDGGGGLYYYDSADTTSADNGGTVIIADDGGRWKLASTECISAKQFGAKGDGVTDDSAVIQAAVDFLGENGGGRLYFPAGTYLLSASGIMILTDFIHLSGDGQGVSILRVADNANVHCIQVGDHDVPVVGGSISGLEIDGNRASNTGGHGIRMLSVSQWEAYDFYIHDSAGYGIGMQVGSFQAINIRDGVIENTGSDGIDMKNTLSTNKDISFARISVRGHGQSAEVTTQAGIDCRGPCRLVSCSVSDFGPSGTVGIRMREGESSDVTGAGANFSRISDCNVSGTTDAGVVGYYIAARQCGLDNSYASTCDWAVDVLQRDNIVSNCHAQSCTNGFRFRSPSSLPTDANDCIVTGCHVRSGTGDGFYAQADRVKFIGCCVTGMNRGFVTAATADATTLIGNTATSNTTSYDNFGTNTINANNTFV